MYNRPSDCPCSCFPEHIFHGKPYRTSYQETCLSRCNDPWYWRHGKTFRQDNRHKIKGWDRHAWWHGEWNDPWACWSCRAEQEPDTWKRHPDQIHSAWNQRWNHNDYRKTCSQGSRFLQLLRRGRWTFRRLLWLQAAGWQTLCDHQMRRFRPRSSGRIDHGWSRNTISQQF